MTLAIRSIRLERQGCRYLCAVWRGWGRCDDRRADHLYRPVSPDRGKGEGLADRARRRRAEAWNVAWCVSSRRRRMMRGSWNNVFHGLPRLIDLIARTGPEVRIIGVRMEPRRAKAGPEVEHRNCDAVVTAP